MPSEVFGSAEKRVLALVPDAGLTYFDRRPRRSGLGAAAPRGGSTNNSEMWTDRVFCQTVQKIDSWIFFLSLKSTHI